MSLTVLGIAATYRNVYALRGDGAVFVLFKRGDLTLDGKLVAAANWQPCPAVPGTEAAAEQAG